jgi:hypothetical protein
MMQRCEEHFEVNQDRREVTGDLDVHPSPILDEGHEEYTQMFSNA